MSIFNWISDFFQPETTQPDQTIQTEVVVNPATGYLMIDGVGSVDSAGNPYGTDLSDHSFDRDMHDDWSSHSHHDDSCDSHSFDDGFDLGSDSFGSSSFDDF